MWSRLPVGRALRSRVGVGSLLLDLGQILLRLVVGRQLSLFARLLACAHLYRGVHSVRAVRVFCGEGRATGSRGRAKVLAAKRFRAGHSLCVNQMLLLGHQGRDLTRLCLSNM